MIDLSELNANSLILAIATGLAGWVLRDLRNRLWHLERKSEAVIVALFYLVTNDPKVPEETKQALRQAMIPR
jgi:hypothetical protein